LLLRRLRDINTYQLLARIIEPRNRYLIGFAPSSRPNDGKYRETLFEVLPPRGIRSLLLAASPDIRASPKPLMF
jgi:hypothetical protein